MISCRRLSVLELSLVAIVMGRAWLCFLAHPSLPPAMDGPWDPRLPETSEGLKAECPTVL